MKLKALLTISFALIITCNLFGQEILGKIFSVNGESVAEIVFIGQKLEIIKDKQTLAKIGIIKPNVLKFYIISGNDKLIAYGEDNKLFNKSDEVIAQIETSGKNIIIYDTQNKKIGYVTASSYKQASGYLAASYLLGLMD